MELEKILDVIETGANTRGRFSDFHGHYCAVGSLAVAAGLKPYQADSAGEAYGTTPYVMANAAGVNDRFALTKSRRLALREYFTRVSEGGEAMKVASDIKWRHPRDARAYIPRKEA